MYIFVRNQNILRYRYLIPTYVEVKHAGSEYFAEI